MRKARVSRTMAPALPSRLARHRASVARRSTLHPVSARTATSAASRRAAAPRSLSARNDTSPEPSARRALGQLHQRVEQPLIELVEGARVVLVTGELLDQAIAGAEQTTEPG